jgi:two-component system sensor histidine kinase KdpD
VEKDKRPDPDALLAGLEEERRGKLTVFLGAAAGVGKTYAMLQVARERLAEGVDVVVGWVETHGRAETEALLKGLPVIPPRRLIYRGKEFVEMDLDALLARRPELALVDELAHTNIPGSRHVRRYQDVEELLSAGIDVYTTLNIQHLESLNDIVAQITGVRVHETVPDRMLEAARIHLVDIPPEELIQRLKDGKVYVPEQAAEALRRFFRPGNINALRELALRYTAQRVDRQVEWYMRLHGIAGPWPAGERVMVCVSPSPFSARLIRIGRRMAEGLQAEWLAAYVETPRRLPVGELEKDRLARNLRLAEELGAETVIITGQDVARELLELARRRNVSQIIIGKPLHSRLWEWMHGSVVDKIIRHSEGISVHVIPGKPVEGGKSPRTTRVARRTFSFLPYVLVLGTTAFLTAFAYIFRASLGQVNIALLFLVPVLGGAMKWGTGPAVVAALSGALAFDFLFVPPIFSFTAADLRYLISFAIFLLVAVLTGTLSTRLQQQVNLSRWREAQTAALYALSREIAAVSEPEQVLQSVVRKVAEAVEARVTVLLPDDKGNLVVRASSVSGGDELLGEDERAVATWVFVHGEKAGRGTDTLSASAGLYLPLRTGEGIRGVLGIYPGKGEEYFSPDQIRLLEAFAGLTALVVTRIQLAQKAREARLLAESERLRTALFNSLSHDLRTPLATIIGAVTGLLEGEGVYDSSARRELLQSIKHEAARMNRFVNNLLDMARLESGVLTLRREWCDIQDIIGVAVARLDEVLHSRPLKIDVEPGLPLVQADCTLIEQVLVNLLENAVKYSEPGSEIAISARYRGDRLEVAVANRGPQIPPVDLERIFDKFYRLKSPRLVSGTGLGLAICRGIIAAHGGKIWASNHPAGGVVITFQLPLGETVPDEAPAVGNGEEYGN